MTNAKTDQIRLLLAAIFIHLVYLVAVYFLLTTDNPFNFNNNYHLIAFVTLLITLINVTLFVVYISSAQLLLKSEAVEQPEILPKSGMAYFAAILLLVALTILPFVLYFMLMDDFVIRVRILIPVLVGLALFAYAYWGSWGSLIERKSMVRRIFYLAIFIMLALLLLDILTGIIPTPIRSDGGSVIFPL